MLSLYLSQLVYLVGAHRPGQLAAGTLQSLHSSIRCYYEVLRTEYGLFDLHDPSSSYCCRCTLAVAGTGTIQLHQRRNSLLPIK